MVTKRTAKTSGAVLVVSLLGGLGTPWIAGVERRVYFDHELDGSETWYRVCTEEAYGTCADSEHFTGTGQQRIELQMRFRPGLRRVSVAACNADGCAEPVVIEAEVPIEWDF